MNITISGKGTNYQPKGQGKHFIYSKISLVVTIEFAKYEQESIK